MFLKCYINNYIIHFNLQIYIYIYIIPRVQRKKIKVKANIYTVMGQALEINKNNTKLFFFNKFISV